MKQVITDRAQVSPAITPFKPTPSPPLHFVPVQRTFSAFQCLFSFAADGVFGRCQELAGADLHAYQLSSSALRRLRILLQKLAGKGTARLSRSERFYTPQTGTGVTGSARRRLRE